MRGSLGSLSAQHSCSLKVARMFVVPRQFLRIRLVRTLPGCRQQTMQGTSVGFRKRGGNSFPDLVMVAFDFSLSCSALHELLILKGILRARLHARRLHCDLEGDGTCRQ